MAVAAVFEFGKEALDAYDQMVDHHDELRNQPHRRLHVCFETDTGYMVVDVWDSLEDFEQFGELLENLVEEFPFRADLKLRTVHRLI
jgi:heme-degrading monooxygenase HmoA